MYTLTINKKLLRKNIQRKKNLYYFIITENKENC
jgi:hypothetical protein